MAPLASVRERRGSGEAAAQFIGLASFPALPRDGFNVGNNLCLDYRPNNDVILAFAVDDLFNEHDVRYLDRRTQGSNNLVPSPSPGITLQGSLKVRFGDESSSGTKPAAL